MVAALSAALLAAQSFATWKVLAASFETLEQAQGEHSIAQARNAFEADLNQLAISVHDYSEWDDAYDFVETRDQHWVRSNITVETLSNMRVDFVWMIDAAGAEILSLERLPGHSDFDLPGPADKEIIQTVGARLPVLMAHPEIPPLGRLFQTRRG